MHTHYFCHDFNRALPVEAFAWANVHQVGNLIQLFLTVHRQVGSLWQELAKITGDEGGRSVLKRHADRVRLLPLPDRMAVLDLDTPEDWAAWFGRPLPSV